MMLFALLPSEVTRWYDNEWGYSNRCVDLALFIGNKLRQSNPQKATAKTWILVYSCNKYLFVRAIDRLMSSGFCGENPPFLRNR